MVKKLKADYYQEHFHKHKKNAKETWKAVREICNYTSNNNPPTELIKIKPTPEESLDEINLYFTSIGCNLATQTLKKQKFNWQPKLDLINL